MNKKDLRRGLRILFNLFALVGTCVAVGFTVDAIAMKAWILAMPAPVFGFAMLALSCAFLQYVGVLAEMLLYACRRDSE